MIRFSPRRLVIPLCLMFAVTGCSMTFDATRLGVPATMASAAGAPAEGQPFKVTSRAVYAFWGLAKLSEPSLQKALAAQLVGGSRSPICGFTFAASSATSSSPVSRSDSSCRVR